MSDKKEKKQYKVVFNGTKKEIISTSAGKYSKFINNIIHQYANVKKYYNI